MPDWRNYAKNRQMVSFNEFIADSSEYGLYCINKGVYRVLRYLAKERGLWRSTYYINLFDNGYTCPDVDDFVPIDRAISEFLGGDDMSCDLLSGLRGIESAIRAIQCGGGGGGISVGPDGGIRYGSGRLYESPVSDGAAQSLGFEDLTAYNEHKCQAANAIVSGLIASINNLAGLSLFNLVAGGTVLFAVGLLSNPPLAIVAIVAGIGLATGAFYALADAIDDNRQSLVCALYNSNSTIEAYDELKGNLSEIVIEVYGVEIGVSAIVDMLAYMCNTDVLSSLFTKVGLPEIYQSIPCNCGQSWVSLGNPKNVDYGAYVITSEFVEAESQYTIRMVGGCNIKWLGPQVTLSLYYEVIHDGGYYVSHNPPGIGTVFTNVQYFNVPRTQSEGPLSVNIEFVE